MSGAYFPLCLWCKHLDSRHHENLQGWRCDAFPSAIPAEILEGTFLHLEVHPNDAGIQFERQTDENLMPVYFVKMLNTRSIYSSDTLLQMSIDMTGDQLSWRWDPERYPKKTDVKTDE
jgi:hypothetical protein